MTYTLNGTDLQEITSEKHTVKADLEQVKFPLSTTQEVQIFDYQGVDRVIRLSGIAYFSSLATMMDSFITPIESLMNGDQSPVTYHSDIVDNATSGDYTAGNFQVKVDNFEWSYMDTGVLRVQYSLVLYEGQ